MMLRLVLFCLAFLTGTAATAQSVLSQKAYERMLSYGTESYSALNASGSFFNTGTPGADTNTFHFDRYAFEAQPAAITEYQIPGGFPFDTLFPNATHVVVSNSGGSFNYYNYMQLTSDAMLYMGDAAGDENGLFSLQVYDPPFPLYSFPVAVGDEGVFTCNRRDHLGRPGRLDMEYSVESSGQLVTAGGSEPVLLMRRTFIYTDSVDLSGQPRIERRKWARLELIALTGVSSYINVDTSTVNDVEPYVESITYNQLRAPNSTYTVAPIPAHSAITALFPHPMKAGGGMTVEWRQNSSANVTIEIYDVIGRLVSTSYYGYRRAGDATRQIHDLPSRPGLYFLVLRLGKTAHSAPFRLLP